MAGMDLPLRAIREQIASAVDVIVQLTRLRDGTRRVTHVTEVQGMEGETVTLQDAFLFDYSAGVDAARASSSASRCPPASGRGSPTGSTSSASSSRRASSAWPSRPARGAGADVRPLLLVVGLAAVAAALLRARPRRPARPGRARVPLSRLDPTVAPSASALAGAGAAAGAAVEKVLVKRGRLAAGAAALERAGMTMTPARLRAGRRRWPPWSPARSASLLGGLAARPAAAWSSSPFGARLLLEVPGRPAAGARSPTSSTTRCS